MMRVYPQTRMFTAKTHDYGKQSESNAGSNYRKDAEKIFENN